MNQKESYGLSLTADYHVLKPSYLNGALIAPESYVAGVVDATHGTEAGKGFDSTGFETVGLIACVTNHRVPDDATVFGISCSLYESATQNGTYTQVPGTNLTGLGDTRVYTIFIPRAKLTLPFVKAVAVLLSDNVASTIPISAVVAFGGPDLSSRVTADDLTG